MNINELRKLFARKKEKYDEIKVEGDMKEVRELHGELKDLKERIELLQNERDLELESLPTPKKAKVNTTEIREMDAKELDKAYEKTFLRAFRQQKLTERDREIFTEVVERRDVPDTTPYFSTAVDADGGFIVPVSVSTKIEEYMREGEFDLTTLVDVQVTSVLKGEVTYEKLGSITPWPNVSQWETIEEQATPQFERKSYEIQDYAGILPIPRTLLQDTDQNLLDHIAKYIAKKTIVTRNTQILAVIEATFTQDVDVVSTDDIFDILDLELDPAFLSTTTIVTNTKGYNFLRKLKYATGENIMQRDIDKATIRVIDGHRVVVLPERTLASDGTDAPVYIGNFKEGIKFMDRGVYEVTPTTIGGKAFERNSYDIRVIDRFDVMEIDDGAVVKGLIDTAANPDPDNDGG